MTALIEPTDPRYFRCTSDGSYDRHTYKVVFNNSKSLKFDNWEEAQACWFEKKALGQFKTIEVLDRKRKK